MWTSSRLNNMRALTLSDVLGVVLFSRCLFHLQAAARRELKSWCLSLLGDKDIHVPAQTRYQELLLEPPAAEPNPLSADSNASLSTNNTRSRCAEQMRSRTYFEMKEDSSGTSESAGLGRGQETSVTIVLVQHFNILIT